MRHGSVAGLMSVLVLAGGLAFDARAQEPPSESYRAVVAHEAAAQAAARAGDAAAADAARAEALRVAQALDRPRLTAALLHRLGHALLAAQRTQDAVLAFESGVLALARDPALKLDTLVGRLGEVRKGVPAREAPVPVDLYSDAAHRDLATEEADEALAARLLIGVGNSYLRQPQDGPALNAYQLALRQPEIERLPTLKAHVLANRGEALRRQGRLDEAEPSLREAVALMERTGPPLEARRALALLGGVYRDRGDAARAQAHYARAIDLYRRAADPRGEAAARAGLGHLMLRQGRCDAALPEYAQAIALATPADGHVLWPAWLGVGRCERARGRLDAAADALERSHRIVQARQGDLRTDEGKVGLLESAQDLHDERVAVELQRAAKDAQAYRRLLDLTEGTRGSALQALMQGWGSSRPTAAALGLPACVPPPPPAARDAAAGPAAVSPMAQMAIGVGVPQALPNAAAFPDAAALPHAAAFPNAAAFPDTSARRVGTPGTGPGPVAVVAPPPPLARLVFHVFDDRTLVLAVAPDGRVAGHVAPLGRAAVAQRVAQLRRALDVDTHARGVRGATPGPAAGAAPRDDANAVARDLYQALVAPLAPHLPPPGEVLAIEPHDALWLLPFAALRAPGGDWMGARWPLVYAPSGELLDEARRRPGPEGGRPSSALIVGNPVPAALGPGDDAMFRLGFAPLPGADDEARRIGAMFKGEGTLALHGADGSLEAVVRAAHGHDVVHLATHGIARSDDPLASFVLLAPSPCGELLTARRVMTLALKADLVALSACQTGLGRVAGEGVLGLSRAFLFAGARSVLVSHWSISDQATTRLMTGFYRRYLEQGLGKARALQQSMAELRAQAGFEHPRYWAPFFLVGAE
jgi:tetratricopeptide (TPR) repeat protein